MSKKLRDPGAPKRNLSAYLLFQNAMRNQFKAQNPGMTFGQLAKYTSAMYSELTPTEKEVWSQNAEADKTRYELELSTYNPPPGYDSLGNVIGAAPQSGPKRNRGKTDRDINAPKRNMSAYLLYQNAMRDPFKAENPGMTFGQLAKYTSHMYKNLTPEERAVWDERANADRERYLAEMSGYVPPPGYDGRGILINGLEQAKKRSRKLSRDANAPKRARGAFVFFTLVERPIIMNEFPGIKFVDVGHLMGERWRNLSPEEKKKYEDMAAQDKVRYDEDMQKFEASSEAMPQIVSQTGAMTSDKDAAMMQIQPNTVPQEAQTYYDMGNMISSTNNYSC